MRSILFPTLSCLCGLAALSLAGCGGGSGSGELTTSNNPPASGGGSDGESDGGGDHDEHGVEVWTVILAPVAGVTDEPIELGLAADESSGSAEASFLGHDLMGTIDKDGILVDGDGTHLMVTAAEGSIGGAYHVEGTTGVLWGSIEVAGEAPATDADVMGSWLAEIETDDGVEFDAMGVAAAGDHVIAVTASGSYHGTICGEHLALAPIDLCELDLLTDLDHLEVVEILECLQAHGVDLGDLGHLGEIDDLGDLLALGGLDGILDRVTVEPGTARAIIGRVRDARIVGRVIDRVRVRDFIAELGVAPGDG